MGREIMHITQESMWNLSSGERYHALEKYHEWLKKVRKDEARQKNNLVKKIHKFKNHIRLSNKLIVIEKNHYLSNIVYIFGSKFKDEIYISNWGR